MEKNGRILVVSGLGALEEYLVAAAAVLRRHPGAELAFASRQMLPDVLEGRMEGREWRRVLLLGVGLSVEPERLRKALRAAKKAGAGIEWLSAYGIGIPAGLPDDIRRLFDARVGGEDEDLVRVAARTAGAEAADLLALHDGKGGGAAASWRERMAAAEWSFANTRGLEPLESLARDLAAGEGPEAWDAAARRLVASYRSFGYRRLVAESPAMRRLRKDIGRIARSGAMRVLVTDESGVGKETVAQQLHVQSERKGPFLAFNCATVARDLLESRLFGHVRGAFTGAASDSPGLFREADGGTLFLDEIAELPPDLQGVLLRVLQEGRIQPVGSAREIAVDVRVVAATNRDLAARVREGSFREDLYWRLAVAELRVPPLRERPEDLRPIAREMWRAMAPGRKSLSAADLDALSAWSWPGNVRELGNVLERAALFPDRTIPELLEEERTRSGLTASTKTDAPAIGEDVPLDEIVRAHVRGVWERHGKNATETARVLGISRNTVREKLERF